MTKRKTKRSNDKYSNLKTHLNLKTRSDLLDCDYLDKLSEEEKEYLNNFNKEYIITDFNDEKRIHKRKTIPHPRNKSIREVQKRCNILFKDMIFSINRSQIRVITKNHLKKLIKELKLKVKECLTKEKTSIKDYYKTEAENRNNARNRCILTRARASGRTLGLDYVPEGNYLNKNSTEDTLIEFIDNLNFSEELKKKSNN